MASPHLPAAFVFFIVVVLAGMNLLEKDFRSCDTLRSQLERNPDPAQIWEGLITTEQPDISQCAIHMVELYTRIFSRKEYTLTQWQVVEHARSGGMANWKLLFSVFDKRDLFTAQDVISFHYMLNDATLIREHITYSPHVKYLFRGYLGIER